MFLDGSDFLESRDAPFPLSNDLDVIDTTGCRRDQHAVPTHPLKMQLDGLNDGTLGLCRRRTGGHTAGQVGNVRGEVRAGILNDDGVTHVTTLFPEARLLQDTSEPQFSRHPLSSVPYPLSPIPHPLPMTHASYELPGTFYLGREYDPATKQTGADLLYDSRDLTTHAICIGMTGSGKTGLCLSLLEEAAIDGVPAIAIDPKGDIANLLLTFPELRSEDFRPWVDEGEAARKGKSVDEFAAATAETWRKGLGEWGQDGARIQRLRDAAEVAIYTPGSEAGRPLSVLRSFAAPPAETLADTTALKERIASSVAGLLALLGIEADPIKSREHILLSAILDAAWRKGQSPDLAGIIQAVQKPPFDKIGVFDLESFYAAKDRTELALRINGLLAAPGFESWLAGDALDVQKLLYTDTGHPRISIISIAHLNDAERMFVVTLIANEMVAWMRRQPGTTSLRALLYMDEVFGFFPPSAMPPSKLPLLTLMKQARAFGIGVVLATQNPVDLDYKGLGNAGTWFIGRLQTERDKARVLEGLLGSEAAGGLDRAGYEALMSNLTQRTFLMRNVHDDAPVLFRTRWAMSYLRGPLTLTEIKRVTAGSAPVTPAHAASTAATATAASAAATTATSSARPVVQHGVTERFMVAASAAQAAALLRSPRRPRPHTLRRCEGRPGSLADHLLPRPGRRERPGLGAGRGHRGTGSQLRRLAGPGRDLRRRPGRRAVRPRHKRWTKALGDHVYRNVALELPSCPSLKMTAEPGMSEGEFRSRVALAVREKRDAAIEALRKKYGTKLATLEDRERRATQKVEREKAQASEKTLSSAVSVGSSLLGALFGGGRRGSAVSKASTAARSVSRASKERADVAHAEAEVDAVREQIAALNAELETEVTQIESEFDPATIPLETTAVKPRKADIAVEDMALVWVP
jgi:hypothetical protein